MLRTRNQVWAFVDQEWLHEKDDAIMQKLLHSTPIQDVSNPEIFRNLLHAFNLELSAEFNNYFSVFKVVSKVQREHTQFNYFRDYLNLPGVQYDPMRITVEVTQQYWDHIRGVSQTNFLFITYFFHLTLNLSCYNIRICKAALLQDTQILTLPYKIVCVLSGHGSS